MTASAAAAEVGTRRAAPRLGHSARFPAFDSFRAIAALSVFVFHAGPYMGGTAGGVGRYIYQTSIGFPTLGVVVFFLISAFLLYRPFAQARHDGALRPPLVPYTVRRIARIVPAYWLALLVIAAVLGRTYVFTPSGIGTYFGFLQVYNAHTEQSGVAQAWTLDVELTFYAALAILAYLMGRRPPSSTRSWLGSELGMCAVLIAGSMLWQAAVLHWVPSTSRYYFAGLITLPASFDLFGMGMALAVLSVAVGDSRPAAVRVIDRAPWLPWLAAAVIYWSLVQSSGWYGSLGQIGAWLSTHELRALFAVCLLLPGVFGTMRRGWVRKLLVWRPLLWVGTVSYGVYLWHVAVLVELDKAGLHHALGGLGFLLASLALTLAVAAVSWYLVEHPALTLARRLSGLRPAEARAATPAAPLSVRAP